MLTQRGFSSQVIEHVLSDYLLFTAADEKQALVYQGEKAVQKNIKNIQGEHSSKRSKAAFTGRGFHFRRSTLFCESGLRKTIKYGGSIDCER
ncbi:hypothetical protein QS257_05565 [Terrilactibacillus sp. S3-3]|nr:hypothetical protein QS257_05565 [Terrilactibacillus sp. S3-3]